MRRGMLALGAKHKSVRFLAAKDSPEVLDRWRVRQAGFVRFSDHCVWILAPEDPHGCAVTDLDFFQGLLSRRCLGVKIMGSTRDLPVQPVAFGEPDHVPGLFEDVGHCRSLSS